MECRQEYWKGVIQIHQQVLVVHDHTAAECDPNGNNDGGGPNACSAAAAGPQVEEDQPPLSR